MSSGSLSSEFCLLWPCSVQALSLTQGQNSKPDFCTEVSVEIILVPMGCGFWTHWTTHWLLDFGLHLAHKEPTSLGLAENENT